MALNQVDVLKDVLKRINLIPLLGRCQIWQYFRFETKEGKVLESSQVNINLSLCVCELRHILVNNV